MSGRDPRHDVLFEPVRIGPKTLRNRFYQVPHCTGFGVEKPWTQARHRSLKAEGGWASVCTEYCAINAESDEYPFVSARLWDDGDVRALRLMTEGAHEHGALAAVELWHGGIHVEARESRTVPLAPSQIASEFEPLVVPKAMELSDIRRTQEDWVAAALRAREAGFDIVYVYGSHTYLPTQFLSPRYNHRTDAYGGSFENRARFWLETLEQVRAAVGDDCAIAIRIAADTLDGAGIEPEEGLAFIRAAEPLVDLFDCVVGGLAGAARLDAGASRFFDTGYQLEWTSRFREATAKPIVGTGLMVDPDVMADVIESGVWDLIGAARPSIADPFLPRKIEEGRYDEIRACIGCNACYALANRGRHLGCTQNATAGEEHRRGWHPERFERAANADREVLVVGAGPSGLECAIVLAKRGFARVRLVDAAAEIGGCMRWIPQLPGLDAWSRFVEWRRRESDRLPNLEIETGVRLSAADVRASGAGLVVVATGAHWAPDGFNGVTKGPIPGADATLPHMLTPEQIMLGGKPVPGGASSCSTSRATTSARASPCASPRGPRGDARDAVRDGRRLVHVDARGPAPARATPRRGGRDARRRDARGDRARRGALPAGPRRRAVRRRRRRGRPRHATPLERGALPRARSRSACPRRGGHRSRLPHRRLRRPPLARRHGLRRPPPRPRDRQPQPRRPPADAARASRPRLTRAAGDRKRDTGV